VWYWGYGMYVNYSIKFDFCSYYYYFNLVISLADNQKVLSGHVS
jgi:hypothetical protein